MVSRFSLNFGVSFSATEITCYITGCEKQTVFGIPHIFSGLNS